MAYPLIIDFPDSKGNTFLNEQEKHFILQRLVNDQGGKSAAEGKVTRTIVWKTAKDWKVWSFSFMYFSAAVGAYAWTLFLPIILERGFGFTQELAFVLTTPPQLFSAFVIWGLSWWADRLRTRGPFVVLVIVVGIVGLCMVGFAKSSTVR